jgi:subtilisin family serine protease
MDAAVRIGLIDSGCSAAHASNVVAAAAFGVQDGVVRRGDAQPDRLGHGSRIADVLLHFAPQAELVVAQVFGERLATSALQVAAAIDWAVANEAHILNLSLGLRAPRAVLAEACARAHAAGVLLCAAAPTRGAPVFPAAFADMLRVTGDARCAREEVAALGAAHADFGAHVRPLDGTLSGAGASMACAHVSGLAARHFTAGGGPATLRAWLQAQARFHGVEDRAREAAARAARTDDPR